MKLNLLSVKKTLFFCLVSLGITAQNAITLDPNTTTNSKAKILVEGVGSQAEFVPSYITTGGSVGSSYIMGIYAYPTYTAYSNSLASIVGVANKSYTENIGVLGIGGGRSVRYFVTYNYGAKFYGYGHGESNTNVYGFEANVYNQSRSGSIYGGNIKVNNSQGMSNWRYGLVINNTSNYNDTTRAHSRYGLLVNTSGKMHNYGSLYGINSQVFTYSDDTVTYNSPAYASYNYASLKNKQTNYSVYGVANNRGTGNAIGGFFSANESGSLTANGTRKGIEASAASNNSDTVTVNNRYGVHALVNGHTKYGSVAILGQNSSQGDTLTSNSRTGVYGSASGKAKYGSIGVQGSVSADIGSKNNLYAGNFITVSHGNNYSSGIYANAYGGSTSSSTIQGVYAEASSNNPVNSTRTYGVYTQASGASSGTKYGIFATTWGSGLQYAGYFQGNVHINGSLSKNGGTFKIDHPQDPENKYLVHSFVESPEMKNIYDGTITTNATGDATVEMPSYFQALNVSFRYQLTVIGQFAQAIISEEISGNSFKIKTDKPNVKVSWMVTGVRNDEWAKANPIVVEQPKLGTEKGKYLNPELHKQPATMGIHTASQQGNQTDEARYKAMLAQEELNAQQRLEENLRSQQEQQQAQKNREAEQKRMEEENAKRNEVEIRKEN